MKSCLAIDVAKSKSMVTLVSSSGEVLIDPYEVNHSINDFTNLLNRINKFKLDAISVIMESTGIYHRPIERFFLENNFKVFVINPIYGKMKKPRRCPARKCARIRSAGCCPSTCSFRRSPWRRCPATA